MLSFLLIQRYNPDMRSRGLMVICFAISAFAADITSNAPLLPCPPADSAACNPSKKDLKEAKTAFLKGLKLQKEKHTNDAFEQFETAARLEPRNVNYLTSLEFARQQSVYEHLQAGNVELQEGKQAQSLDDFRAALQLDPKNVFAQQRVQDALGDSVPKIDEPVRIVDQSPEIRLTPEAALSDFHYKGDSRGLLTQVAAAFRIEVQMDDSVVSRPVRFDISSVDFATAMSAAAAVTRTFWTPMGPKQILIAADTAENHRQYDRMAMRTFYIPGVSTPADLTNVSNVLRNVFEIKLVSQEAGSDKLTVRAPQNILDAATEFIENLDDSRPQVMLDVEIYQISHTFMRKIGLGIPDQFNLFNIPIAALAGIGGQNIQSLINQLISSGGINQANSQSIAGLLAQLQGQGNSIFSQPLATFGGGLTFEGLSLGTLAAQLSLNESAVKDLQHATLRVSQGNDATFHMGERYPILNATFAPIFNTPAISQVLQNNSFQAPFPSFSYEDIGLTLKAKPTVHSDSDVSLDVEMQVRSLAGQSVNGVPILANREYKGSITLMDGEPAVVAGSVSRNEARTMTGLPGLGFIPGLNHVMTSNTKEVDDDELMVVITPRVIHSQTRNESPEIWIAR
jgi:type II secretory pathway component GspD/PulD (secretin)